MVRLSPARPCRRAIIAAAATLALGFAISNAPASAASNQHGPKHGRHPPPVSVSVKPEAGSFTAVPCGATTFTVTLTNDRSHAIYTDVYVKADPALVTSRSVISSYLPANYTYDVPLKVTAPDADPGSYEITVDGHREPVSVPVTLKPLGEDASDNLARSATPSASSTHASFSLCGPIDGNRNQADWQRSGWNDGTMNQFPDWYQLTFAERQQVGAVEVVTRPGSSAIRDWDVQVRENGQWVTVDKVRGNESEVVRSSFDPVTTSAARLLIHGANDGKWSRILEMEVYE